MYSIMMIEKYAKSLSLPGSYLASVRIENMALVCTVHDVIGLRYSTS